MVMYPLLVSGFTTQRQWVKVNYFTSFTDDPSLPATEFLLEIQSKFIQVYSAKITIHAELSGLRHIMYHHPWISSVSGILGNIFTLSVILILSWSRFNSLHTVLPAVDKESSEFDTDEEVVVVQTKE